MMSLTIYVLARFLLFLPQLRLDSTLNNISTVPAAYFVYSTFMSPSRVDVHHMPACDVELPPTITFTRCYSVQLLAHKIRLYVVRHKQSGRQCASSSVKPADCPLCVTGLTDMLVGWATGLKF